MRTQVLPFLVALACNAAPTGGATSGTSKSNTASIGSGVSTGGSAVLPTAPSPLFVWSAQTGGIAYFGTALAESTSAAGEVVLTVSAPSESCPEDCVGPHIYAQADPLSSGGPVGFDWGTVVNGSVDYYFNPRLGMGLIAPGDVTGDGATDLVAFDDPADSEFFSGNHALLLPGPVEDRGSLHVVDDLLELSSPAGVRGAVCGDLDGDGIPELCTNEGIYQGPVAAGAAPLTTWSAAAPTLDVLVGAAGQGDLYLWNPAAAAVHRLTTFPAGDLDPSVAAAASWTAPGGGTATALVIGDLDGDGDDDIALAWTDGSQSFVYVAIDAAGGALDAGTVLPLPAAALAIADFDGDGTGDLAVGGASEVRIFRGPFAPGALAPEDAAAWWIGEEYPDDHFGDALLAVDLDSDGKFDLVVGAPEFGTGPDYLAHLPMGRVYGMASGL